MTIIRDCSQEDERFISDIEGVIEKRNPYHPDFRTTLDGIQNHKIYKELLDFVSTEMEDTSGWIGYYVDEDDWGKNGFEVEDSDGKEIPFSTLEDVYDCIKKH